MLFNSVDFFIFLIAVCALVFTIPSNWRKYFLLSASYFFYAYWDAKFLSLILLSTLVDFFCGLEIEKSSSRSHKKKLLTLSLIINLGILSCFKYFDFFASSLIVALNSLGLNLTHDSLGIILPVGISFYTFQTLSYTIDVYRGNARAENNLFNFALYVCYFPQLVAGPIERPDRLLPQLKSKIQFNLDNFLAGSELILIGLVRKVVFADILAQHVDYVFLNPAARDSMEIISGVIFFSFQIYYDFAGYSLIAIGVSRLFGINLMTNFKTPYFSKGFKDFWSRWHISLSTWFRDYLYIPLGGSKDKSLLTFRNIAIVFCLSGLWHGADWKFVLWGAIHGGLVIFEHFLTKLNIKTPKFLDPLFILLTFLLTSLAWVPFRSKSIEQALLVYEKLMSITLGYKWITETFINGFLLIVILFLYEYLDRKTQYFKELYKLDYKVRVGIFFVSLFLLILMGVDDGSVFIYFQF